MQEKNNKIVNGEAITESKLDKQLLKFRIMKKNLSLIGLTFMWFIGFSQTIVSTSSENKNVILEEFTGIHCGYCPQGHAIAQSIKDAHPDDVFLINIHTGSYSTPSAGEPDYRTNFGTAIANQSGLTGYPAGTVNRHLFSGWSQGSGTAMSRNYWTGAANQILGVSSYINVGVEAEINVSTRELTVHVEAYYTGDSPQSTNFLNVALLQDNTLGPQAGGNMGNEYVHMHRLVHMITGQWGEEISTTTTGSFIDRTYTYTIPAVYKNVPAELADLKIVAFISETHQEIISGNGCFPSLTGFLYANDASVEEITTAESSCSPVDFSVTLRNLGSDTLKNIDFTYNINGEPDQIYSWTGSIAPMKTENIDFNNVEFTPSGTNTINVSVNSDENNTNNTLASAFVDSPLSTTIVHLELHTDSYGNECTWNIKNSAGSTVYSGGPYGNNQTVNLTFYLGLDCYMFNLIDSYGDGGGAVTLEDSEGIQLYYTNGVYGTGESQSFTSYSVLPEFVFNPADGSLNVNCSSNITITFNQPVRKTDDSPITNSDIASFISLTDPSQTAIPYTGTINADKTIITVNPDQVLSGNTVITTTIAGSSIESYFDDAVSETVSAFTTVSTSGLDNIAESIDIYPNPASDFLEIFNADGAKLSIYDISGKQIFRKNSINNLEKIDISNINSGIYVITIEINGKLTERKLTIVK